MPEILFACLAIISTPADPTCRKLISRPVIQKRIHESSWSVSSPRVAPDPAKIACPGQLSLRYAADKCACMLHTIIRRPLLTRVVVAAGCGEAGTQIWPDRWHSGHLISAGPRDRPPASGPSDLRHGWGRSRRRPTGIRARRRALWEWRRPQGSSDVRRRTGLMKRRSKSDEK